MGLDARSPHPSPELVKLGEAELVGVFDQDGVDAGNVQTGLDDGGADENIRLAAAEAEHGGFQFAFLHLPVGDHDAGTGNPFPQASGHVFDALDTGHHVEDLAAAIEFLTRRTADGFGVVGGEVGFDGAAGRGRRGDQAHFAHAGQRHVERPGNGGGAEGEHVHFGFEGLDFLLLVHAKALFFVHHHQAQVFELDGFAEQLVGADDHIQFPGLEPLQDVFALLGGAEAVQQPTWMG
jgi:hypothetical protein